MSHRLGAPAGREDEPWRCISSERVRQPHGVQRARRCAASKLDAILLFAQESLYYLTGFDTSGFVFFQCAVLTAGSTSRSRC